MTQSKYNIISLQQHVFKQEVLGFEDCDVPQSKYDVEHYVNHTFMTFKKFGKTYLSMNFTINKETPTVMVLYFFNIEIIK